MTELKKYQQKTLDKLKEFLEKSRYVKPQEVFSEFQEAPGYSSKYKTLEGLENVPYVCLRLPTGGGKTLLSAYAISVASDSYLETEYPVVLWLTPTDIIRTQTLDTLKNPSHPNREILDLQFNGRIKVFDIADFTLVRPQDIGESVCIFVATFASFRVTSTDGRRVYSHNEDMETHFSRVNMAEQGLELAENGEIKFSFANLLAHNHPLVIIDEAHNHTSKLSVEVLQRISPSAIIEFTATPATNSNVLYKVSASELKAEDMIKLPIRLIEHKSWEDAVTTAIQTREHLEELARAEDRYIRPIVLFQAENKDKDVTVEVILKYLTEQEGIPRNAIAIATGTQHELDGINLFDPGCPIKYIITVQALKEGWDCSFAYVFCSTARVHSAKDAEQLLGRVLRMPYVKHRQHEDLNKAYAHVSVVSWCDAVSRIRDNLIGMGFEDVEAESNIQYEQGHLNISEESYPSNIVIYSKQPPTTSSLNLALQADTTVEAVRDGFKVTFVVKDEKDFEELREKASEVYSTNEDRERLINEVNLIKKNQRPLSPSEKGEKLLVPQLCLDFGDGNITTAEREAFLPDGWNILNFPVGLEGFNVIEEEHVYEIDIKGTKISERALIGQESLSLTGVATHWTETQLISWLDRKLRQADIPYTQLVEFIRKHLRFLQENKQVNLAELVRLRYILEQLLRQKIEQCRDEAYKLGVQNVLFNLPDVSIVSLDVAVIFEDGKYPAKAFYKGSFQFSKHFFPAIGAMNEEEIECAKALEMNKKVKSWIRNLERQSDCAFWLPTAKDKFYPDFVSQLDDKRILVVEYKGEHLSTSEDTREKELIGGLWAKQSKGKCLFLMATKKDEDNRDVYNQISNIIESN